jgi:ABC-type Fe3+/spermidine/putrescine transport system ATPase subunit
MTSAPILDITDVHKTYDSYPALKGVSLAVRQGEFIALVGPSGCGKTTLLKQIAGFEDVTSGTISIEGQDMAGIPAAQRPTSMVFQKLALFPHMTVAQNIGFPLKLRKVAPADIAARVAEMITLMELKPEYLSRFPRALSGGEQQRVALARSMISSPKLLLLDEPLSALDVKLKKVLQAELKRLHRAVGVTFVHVTHDLEEAMMLADRICVMRAGRILQLGEPADIYYRPADAFVAGFIGDTNLLPVEVTARSSKAVSVTCPALRQGRLSVPLAQVAEDVTTGPALMMIRPELIAKVGKGAPSECSLMATITELFTKGGTVQYKASTTTGLDLAVEIPGTAELPMRIGDTVELGWRNKDVWLLKAGAA